MALIRRWERLQHIAAVAVVVETVRRWDEDECPTRAAAIAYYTLFSLFPLTIGLTALMSWLLAGLDLQDDLVALVVEYFPAAGPEIQENVEEAIALRGTASIVAVGGLLWSARAVFAAILMALNRAWDVGRPRPLILRTLLQIGLVLSVGLVIVLSLLLTALLRLIATVEVPYIGLRPFDNPGWQLVTTLVPLLLSTFSFLMLYRFLPHAPVAWSDVWLPALLAAGLFEVAKLGFVWYTQNVARFELVYGSLAAVVALLLWAYISGLILLVGAELSAALGHRRLREAAPAA